MVQPVEHDIGSAAGTTILGAAKGTLMYGLLGTATSTIIGAAVGATVLGVAGAAGSLILPTSVAAVAANVVAAIPTLLNQIPLVEMLVPDAIETMWSATGANMAQALPALAATAGAYVGGAGGFLIGGATSLAGGAIAGAMEGQSQVTREQNLANAVQYQKAQGQAQTIAAARGQAAEQYSAMGYMQGLQDGQAAIMNQMAAMAQQQQMAQEQGECKVAKDIISQHHAKHGAQPASHVEKLASAKAEPNSGMAV